MSPFTKAGLPPKQFKTINAPQAKQSASTLPQFGAAQDFPPQKVPNNNLPNSPARRSRWSSRTHVAVFGRSSQRDGTGRISTAWRRHSGQRSASPWELVEEALERGFRSKKPLIEQESLVTRRGCQFWG